MVNQKCNGHSSTGTSTRTEQVGGDHYSKMAIQPIAYIQANNLSYIEGNIIKYVSRYKHKNGLEDLEKSRHYLDMLIKEFTNKV